MDQKAHHIGDNDNNADNDDDGDDEDDKMTYPWRIQPQRINLQAGCSPDPESGPIHELTPLHVSQLYHALEVTH